MPRNRSAGRAPATRAPTRPTATTAPPNPQQQRPASSIAAAPPQQIAPPAPAASQGPGLFGQMASTAAGVAIGSSIGNAIGGFFGGSSEAAPAQPVQAQAQPQPQGSNCEGVTQQFTKCLDDNGGDMQICNWYLEQLKACQAAARQ